MIRKKEKRSIGNPALSGKWITIAVIIGFIVFLIVGKFQSINNRKQNRLDCRKELNRKVAGVVAKAFYDDNISVKAFVVYFTNGKKYINPIFLKSLSGYVDEGDSIYKAPGTFKFFIYKHRYENPIVILEDTIDCDKY